MAGILSPEAREAACSEADRRPASRGSDTSSESNSVLRRPRSSSDPPLLPRSYLPESPEDKSGSGGKRYGVECGAMRGQRRVERWGGRGGMVRRE